MSDLLPESHGARKQTVSITWKWVATLAIAAVTLLSGTVATLLAQDRTGIIERITNNETDNKRQDQQLSAIQIQLASLPTQQDVKELRATIEKLNDRLVGNRGYMTPAQPQ